jgi:putative phage-type endonuclease
MIQQRSDEWFDIRIGKATASRFVDVMATGYNGKPLAGWKNYKAELVAERLTSKAYSELSGMNFTSAAMQWGTDNEPLARLLYKLKTGNEVEECGFFQHDTLLAGASPDGLVNDDGTIEIKCPNTATHIDTLHSGQVPKMYIPQVQGQLWITGRKQADFVSFDPRLPENARLIIINVRRDDAYIKLLEETITKFLKEVDDEVEFVKQFGAKNG